MEISGIVREKKLDIFPDDAQRYARWISRMEDGTVVKIEAGKVRYARSVQQNAFYHGVVVGPIREYLGIESCELMHETLKHLHLSDTVRLPFDRRKKLKIAKSTTDLDTKEFEEYLDRIRTWAMKKLKYRVPYPNEVPLYAYQIND